MDDFLDLIDELHELARELLEGAQELEDLGDNPSLEAAKARLEKLCKALARIVSACEKPGSLLRRLVRSLDGLPQSAPLMRVKQYLVEHRGRLIAMQVPEAVIDRVIKLLEAEATGGDNALDQPQTVDVVNALEPLKELRDVVCEIANAADIALIVTGTGVLKQVAAGCIGAATVVLDITAAIAAGPADPTAWVLLKAVKSVWAGGKATVRAVRELRGMVEKIRALKKEADRRRLPPAPKIKK
jgi:hypothetical protein